MNVLLLLLVGACAIMLWRPAERGPVTIAGRSVVDERGRRIELRPEVGTQAVYMGIGLGPYLMVTRRPDEIIGARSAENDRVVASLYLRKVFPGLARLRLPLTTSETGTTNFERLLFERPGVVVTWARLADAFDHLGLPVVGVLPIGSTARLHATTRLYADIIGDPGRGRDIVARAEASQRGIAAAVASTTRWRPRLLLLLPRSDGLWQVGAGFHDVIAAAGATDLGMRLPRQAFLDAERLIALAPDVIVIIGSPGARKVTPAYLMALPALAALPAIRQRRVYATPPGVSGHMMTSMELPIYAQWLADILHPDERGPGARSLATKVYGAELGVAPSEEEIDRDLATALNARSRGAP